MNQSLEKLKNKDSTTLKSFLTYDFAKDMEQIENLTTAALSQPSVKIFQKKPMARVIANTQALC